MPSVTLTDEQVIALVKQLPAQQKRTVLLAIAADAQTKRDDRMAYTEAQLRQLSAKRSLDWNSLSEEEREAFVDDLLHEER
jgi:hypothetical protein